MKLLRLRKPSPATVIACIALFVALGGTSVAAVTLARNSVLSKHIKNGQVKTADLGANAVNSAKVGNGSLLAQDFAAGQLPAGSQGAKGDKGDRGPSFGDGKQISNMNDIACGQDVVVGSQTLTVIEPSRIWIHGQGTLSDDASDANDYGLWLQLRNAGDTATLAVSTRQWDRPSSEGLVPLTSGGLMVTGDDPDASTPSPPAFVAPAGTYILQLAVTAGPSACAGSLPDFGFNQGNAMGYLLVGSG
ncbi:MAG: hypothetical protein WD805_05150 [Gaiellaceae bacterium]